MIARALALIALLCVPQLAHAQPLTAEEVPPVLEPWVPWVLSTVDAHGCTMRSGAVSSDRMNGPICVWPATLEVTTEEGGGRFVLTVTSDRIWDVELPGEGRVLPIDVRLDGRPAVVVSEGGAPALEVGPGEHRIEGRFVWETPPETLRVPLEVARVFLIEEGVRALAARGDAGEVWLRSRETESVEEDRVTLEVHRLLSDGSPMSLTTRIVVRASGRARELALGDVLPEGALPIDVRANLPARMQPTGELTLQLHAGEFEVTLEALIADPEAAYRRPELSAPWPEQEVWVWAPNETFRQVELSGAAGIDPARTSLPATWRSYSAYLLDESAVLTLATSRRGEPTPPPNELTVYRNVWLDMSGEGFSVQDQLSVTMHSVHRIELAEGALGRMTLAGADQLITVGESGRSGIELRTVSTSLTAEWRREGVPSDLPAVGWSEDAQSSSTTLNLPPGWELIHASGVDRAPGTWVSRWTLLGFFALLIIAAAIGRVIGWQWGALAFVGVGLTFHLEEAPRWIWLTLTVLLALHRALAERRFERWIRWLYLAVSLLAIVMTVVFSAYQIRNALHPQLAPPSYDTGAVGWGSADVGVLGSRSAPSSPEAVAFEREEYPEEARMAASDDLSGADSTLLRNLDSDGMGRGSRTGASGGYASNSAWLDPNAIVQTGFGTPNWSWSTYSLSFDGPVSGGHRIGLVLSPPWLTRFVTFLRAVLMLVLLALVLVKRPVAPPGASAGSAAPTPSAATAAVAALLLTLAFSRSAQAQEIPSTEMLDALRARLTEPAGCDLCSEANSIAVEVTGDVLTIEVEVSASIPTAYPLPGPSSTWVPETMLLDGRATTAVTRLASGFLHARVPEGVHTLRLSGPLGGRDAVTLAFGRSPRAITVAAEGWEVDGLGGETVPGSIQLRRLLAAELSPDAAPMRSELPTWLEVERRIDIGVRWTISSTVRRRSPGDAPAVVRIPLLPGESVNTSNVTVEGGEALVTLSQNEREITWTSTLAPADSVALSAPTTGPINEVWVLACSPLWHCETTGLNPTASASGASWEPQFHPWPGESLSIVLSRPGPAEGASVTVDRAAVTVRPGVRLTTTTVELSVRTSVSTSARVDVPAGTDVRSLTVDGMTRPLSREGDTITVALQPGSHNVVLDLQEGRGWSTVYETPVLTVGSTVVNAELNVDGGSDRWLLWVAGSSWGPAVLFWGYLVLTLALAYALSLRRGIPLKLHDWVLLLVGLTQIPAPAALLVVGWFFVLEHRKKNDIEGALGFDVRQLFIIGYTFVAFGLLVWAVEAGLLGDPDMGIDGPGSYPSHLHFFVDRSPGALPSATLISLDVLVFRALMFVWALWLAVSLTKWARWGWSAFKEGDLFRPLTSAEPEPPAPAGSEPEAPEPASEPAPASAESRTEAGSGASSPAPDPDQEKE